MTRIVFYEKPGCANNSRQKRMLEAAGHEVVARDLLSEAWTEAKLRPFFGGRPVAEWFNRAAPKVKYGEIDPEAFGAEAAIALMLAEPILIRRPLMEADGKQVAGFDPEQVRAWIGLDEPPEGASPEKKADLETCPRSHTDTQGCTNKSK